MKLLERAIRQRWRFDSSIGPLSTEQLWDVDLKVLDETYVYLGQKLRAIAGEGLAPASESTDVSRYGGKMALLKHVYDTRVAESEAKEERVLMRQKADRLDEIIERKKNQELEELSIEELEAMKND